MARAGVLTIAYGGGGVSGGKRPFAQLADPSPPRSSSSVMPSVTERRIVVVPTGVLSNSVVVHDERTQAATEHILTLLRAAASKDSWCALNEFIRTRSSKPMNWMRALFTRYTMPVEMMPLDRDDHLDTYIARVLSHAVDAVPTDLTPQQIRCMTLIALNAAVAVRINRQVLADNALERTGVTLILQREFIREFTAERANISTQHFPEWLIFDAVDEIHSRVWERRGMMRVQANLSPFATAVNTYIHEWLTKTVGTALLHDLLMARWPYGETISPAKRILRARAEIMNAIVHSVSAGTLYPKMERAHALFATVWRAGHVRMDLPMNTFQTVHTRERMDHFTFGPNEYLALCDSAGPYGEPVRQIGAGTYSIVVQWQCPGRPWHAVKLQHLDTDSLNEMEASCAAQLELVVHKALTAAVCRADGGLALEACNIVRLVDHVRFICNLGARWPRVFGPAHCRGKNGDIVSHPERFREAVWQANVMEAAGTHDLGRFARSPGFMGRNVIRASIAQVLGALVAFGATHRLTHYDLTDANVMMSRMDDLDGASNVRFFHYPTAGLWIPAEHCLRHVAKIIDFSLSHIEHGEVRSGAGLGGSLTFICEYNPAADLQTLGVRFLRGCLLQHWDELAKGKSAPGIQANPETLEMIMAMMRSDAGHPSMPEKGTAESDTLIDDWWWREEDGTDKSLSRGLIHHGMHQQIAEIKRILTCVVQRMQINAAAGPHITRDECDALLFACDYCYRAVFFAWGPVTYAHHNAMRAFLNTRFFDDYRRQPPEAVRENTWFMHRNQ